MLANEAALEKRELISKVLEAQAKKDAKREEERQEKGARFASERFVLSLG